MPPPPPPPPPVHVCGTPRGMTPRAQITPRDGMVRQEQRLRGSGVLVVIIESAKVTGSVPLDTYVRASIGRQELRTSVAKRSTAPRWNESLQFKGTLQEFNESVLAVSLWESKSRDHKRSHTTVNLRGVFECAAACSRRRTRVCHHYHLPLAAAAGCCR